MLKMFVYKRFSKGGETKTTTMVDAVQHDRFDKFLVRISSIYFWIICGGDSIRFPKANTHSHARDYCNKQLCFVMQRNAHVFLKMFTHTILRNLLSSLTQSHTKAKPYALSISLSHSLRYTNARSFSLFKYLS